MTNLTYQKNLHVISLVSILIFLFASYGPECRPSLFIGLCDISRSFAHLLSILLVINLFFFSNLLIRIFSSGIFTSKVCKSALFIYPLTLVVSAVFVVPELYVYSAFLSQ